MNTTLVYIPIKAIQRGFISDGQFDILTDAFTIVWLVISFCGTMTNAINIKTFISMGLEDGVTVSFLALSITDIGFSLASFILGSSSIFTVIETKYSVVFPIQPFAVTMFSANAGLILYAITGMTTTFIAIARCMCVAKPFHFKKFFTISRSIIALIFFTLFSLSCYVPILSQMATVRAFDLSVNRTRIVLWLSDIRGEVKDIASFIFDTILFFVTQIVIIICIIVMAHCLRKSGKFRQSSTVGAGNYDSKTKQAFKLSGKELKIVQQVVLISTIYTVCALPKMLTLFNLVEPDYGINKRLHNLYFTISYLRTAAELFNSASTFPVYYFYNSKFRSMCFSARAVIKEK